MAERFFAEPTANNLDEYLRVCGPHYTQRPRPPEILARVTRRAEVSEHFFRGEILRFDFTQRLSEIRCPVLLLAGELDPIVTIEDAEELAAALPPDRVYPNDERSLINASRADHRGEHLDEIEAALRADG